MADHLATCSWPGCPMVVERDDRCSRHRRTSGRSRGSTALNERPKGRHWQKIRAAVLERDGYRCRAELPGGRQCPVTDSTGRQLRVHHVIGLKEGGANTVENCVTLCVRCHNRVEAGKRRR